MDRPLSEVPASAQAPLAGLESAVPTDAEMCKAKAAEFRKRAAEIADPDIKNMYLELAARWLEVSAAYEAIAKSGRPDPSLQ